ARPFGWWRGALVDVEIFRGVEVDPLEPPEVDRVRRRAPRRAERLRVVQRQPERGPAAGRVAAEHAGFGLLDHWEFRLDRRDQFFDQRPPARTVHVAVA